MKGRRGEGHSDCRDRRGGADSFLRTEQANPGAHPQGRHSYLPLSETLLAPQPVSSKFPDGVAAAGLGLLLEKLRLKDSC